MKLRVTLAVALLASGASGAFAQWSSTAPSQWNQNFGPYVSGFGGINWRSSSDFENSTFALFGATAGEANWNTGFGVGGSAGFAFGNGLRLEFETNFRRNKTDELDFGPVRVDGEGRVSQLGLMGNALFDIATGTNLVPQVGFGLGTVRQSVRDFGAVNSTVRVNDSDWGFAYQAIGGLNIMVTPALALGLRYTYFHASDAKDLETTIGGVITTPTTIDPGNHSALLTLRYDFGGPRSPVSAPAASYSPPPPSIAPTPFPGSAAPISQRSSFPVQEAYAPAPRSYDPAPRRQTAPRPSAAARSYLVPFNHDSAALTREGSQVVQQAATSARRGGFAQIEVVGHADRSGTPAHNRALSSQRASTVRAALIRNGVRSNQIAIAARGETRPLVNTADGARNPRNRAVEIVLN